MSRLVKVLIGVVVLVAATGVAGATPPSWQVRSTLSLGTTDTAVDCATSASCWSIEAGRLLSSADGGQSWTDRTDLVPDGVVALNDLDCLAAQRCYFAATDSAGNGVLLYLQNGAITQHPVPGGPQLSSISCTAPAHCVGATGTTSYVTDDGGVEWSQASLGRTLLGKVSVDCITATLVCYLVGNYGLVPTILKSTTRGRSWTMQTAPYDDGGIYDVECPSVTTCYATGANYSDYAIVIRTVDGGDQWTFANVPTHGYPLRSVSCPAVDTCTAIGHAPGNTPFIFATTNGQDWNPQTVAPIATEQPGQVSCPTTTSCAAVASAAAFATTDAGATWQTVDVPAGLEPPYTLTCSTGTRCVGFGKDSAGRQFVITTQDFGATWTRGTLPTDVGHLGGVDCPSRQTCFAVADVPIGGTSRSSAQFLKSTDSGATWSITFTRPVSVYGMTCPTDTTCVAYGNDNHGQPKIYRSTDGGAHWAVAANPGTTPLVRAACASVTSCVFMTGSYNGPWTAYTSDDLGATYQPHDMPAASQWLGLDCAGMFCMAGGYTSGSGAIATSPDGGVTWDAETVPRQAEMIGQVSCGSATACAATTYDFNYYSGGPRIVGTVNAGQTWHLHSVPARNEEPLDVACFNTHCIASDYSDAGNPIIVSGAA